jgi:hypothetical protein
MRLGVPFIAPRQLGAVRSQQGKQFLPSVGWRTGQSGAPPDSHCSMSGADLLPKLAQTTVATQGWLAHRTLSGAHRTVRCPQPTVGAGHTSPAACVADRCFGSRWLTGQSGAPPDSPVHHPTVSVACPVWISFLNWRRRPLQLRAGWRTGHCPVPPADRWRGPHVARRLRGRSLLWRPLAHRTVR